MSQEAIEMLLGRLLTDDDLRQRAATDIGKICHEEGFLLSAEELRMIVPEDFVRLAMVSSWMNTGMKRKSAHITGTQTSTAT
jgi:hypothetical protein